MDDRMVTVLASGESEAMIVRGILEENDIPARISGSVSLPSVYRFSRFEVLVPEEFEAEARRVITDARTMGAEQTPDDVQS
jgi:hypothetical protein